MASIRPTSEPMFPPHMQVTIDAERLSSHNKTAMVTRQISLDPALIEHIVSQVDSAMTKKGVLPGDLVVFCSNPPQQSSPPDALQTPLAAAQNPLAAVLILLAAMQTQA